MPSRDPNSILAEAAAENQRAPLTDARFQYYIGLLEAANVDSQLAGEVLNFALTGDHDSEDLPDEDE